MHPGKARGGGWARIPGNRDLMVHRRTLCLPSPGSVNSKGLTETVLDEFFLKNLSLLSKAKIRYFFTLQHTRKLNPSRQVLKCQDKHGGSLLMRWKGWQACRVGAVVLVHLQRAAIYYSSRCRASPWLWDLRWARKQGGRKKGSRRIESGRRVVSKGRVPGSASPRSLTAGCVGSQGHQLSSLAFQVPSTQGNTDPSTSEMTSKTTAENDSFGLGEFQRNVLACVLRVLVYFGIWSSRFLYEFCRSSRLYLSACVMYPFELQRKKIENHTIFVFWRSENITLQTSQAAGYTAFRIK